MAVQEGNLARLGDLFERHHSRIFRFCMRLTGKAEAAEDLTQETFLRALRYNQSFRGSSEFLPWLYRVARNVCNDHFRRSGVPEHGVDDLPDVASDEAPATEKLELAEDAGRLREALAQLPVGRREVLVLSRFEYRKYDEIAQILGCSVGAVKVRAHRALQQLGDIYKGIASQSSPAGADESDLASEVAS